LCLTANSNIRKLVYLFPVAMVWRVPTLQMEETASRYGW